ncbi:PucR family transcriptional regulator ligand-binding domain-containing protein, partial [Streptacidiphilus anmyonensis]|uniref:PucR family transcriptional regulator ligand-binding domain-containing protein n=1 Tax=Streptacidiphilus anmyonensis TaxID=405782 RepID=UPI000693CA79
MIVGDLLRLEDLRIAVAWATPELLDREVTGVTSTDLQDPARYLRPGELVLTGLVWWRPDELAADPVAAAQAAGRFATALRSAEAAALLAGEGTHGAVPAELAEACRRHGIPLLAVPAGTSFRAVTDRVYLRLWGDLQHQAEGTAAVPAAVRRDVLALLHSGAAPSEVLARAVADLGLPHCSLRTSAGRVLGSSEPDRAARGHGRAGQTGSVGGPSREPGGRGVREAPALPVGEPGVSPFDGWLLLPHAEPAPAATSVLRGLADLLAPLADRAHSTAAAQRQGAARVVDLLRGSGPRRSALDAAAAGASSASTGAAGAAGAVASDAGGFGAGSPGRTAPEPAGGLVPAGTGLDAELTEALRSCGLPAGAALTPVVAQVAVGPASWAAAALAEALQETGAPFAVAPDPGVAESGRAIGLCAAPEALVLDALH